MAYTKQTWADLPSKTTPINAERLTHIEDGIFNAAATADNAASAAGTAVSQIGQVSSRVDTLTGRVNGLDTAVSNKVDKVAGKGLSTNDYDNTDKGKVDSLGTASTKNSTSVVTDSSDLVESGAVEQTLRDAEVIEGKNLYVDEQNIQLGSAYNLRLKYITLTKPLGAGTYTLNMQSEGSADVILQMRYNGSYQGVPSLPFTFTVNSGSTFDQIYFYISQTDYDGGKSATASKIQIEAGTGATAYEPYYVPLKDVVPNKCDNSVIGTVEDGTTASQAYAVGEHFIRDGAFCTCKQAISQGGSFTLNTNYTAGDVASEFGLYIPITNNAGFHNSIFRGKNLGSTVTTAQRNAIQAGTFEDMYIGDYWEINSVKYRIAHFDYWLNCGDTGGVGICTSHHVVVVPDSALVNRRMNAKVDNVDTTAGAYVNSEMRTTNLAGAKTIVNAAFGADNILTHREYMQNAVTDDYESAGAWVNADIELMSEIMVYGSNIFHNVKCGTSTPNLYTVNKTQLALFRLDPSYIICKNVAQTDQSRWWLRDVVSAMYFAGVDNNGGANDFGASGSEGVRPAFGIK